MSCGKIAKRKTADNLKNEELKMVQMTISDFFEKPISNFLDQIYHVGCGGLIEITKKKFQSL